MQENFLNPSNKIVAVFLYDAHEEEHPERLSLSERVLFVDQLEKGSFGYPISNARMGRKTIDII